MEISGFDIIKQAMYSTKLSRMLAQENIAVVFDAKANTASFSPETRTLTFPHNTAFMDQDIHELFMFHEVSHAIHLPHDSMGIVKESNVNFSLFNIVIDIRDERLIKAKYPGAIKTFNKAYEKLLNQGFFGEMKHIIHKSFADRLNVYAKVGVRLGAEIPMSSEEHAFYERCMKAETLDECVELAKELEKMDDGSDTMNDLLGYILEKISEDDEFEELSDKEKLEQAMEELERIRQQRVQDIFDQQFKDSNLTNAHIINYHSMNLKDVNIIRCNEYVDMIKRKKLDPSEEHNSFDTEISVLTESVRTIRKNIKQSVDSMVRVFESKKAAQRYRNAKIADTGIVDMNKVYRYKFDDKVFRKSMKIPNSKNHAYYILVDMSGSMHNQFESVVEQIVVITEFFRRIQVPYKVVGFGATILDKILSAKCEEREKALFGKNPMPYLIKQQTHLIELLSHEQSTADHNIAISGMFSLAGLNLGNTPTGYAMVASEQYANAFFAQTNADKRHMIVMTDGQPTDIYSHWHFTRGYGTMVFVDPVMKKAITTKSTSQYATISALGKIFEHRYGITFTTISIMGTLSEYKTCAFVPNSITTDMKADWRLRGYTNVEEPFTKTEMFFAKPFGVDTDISDMSDDISTKTSAQIARSLLKNMKSIKKSRNFLNALAEKLS